MKFCDTGFWLAARKREEILEKKLWWNFETLGFDWLRGNVRKIEKYFDEILRHWLLIGCEEMCGKVKKTLMKFCDTGFWLAAREREENLEKYFDEIWRHSVLIGCEETCEKLKNTLTKFWDTCFWLAARKREENFLKNTLMKYRDTRFWLAARKRAENLKIL